MAELTSPRWTHVALPSLDIDKTVAWYKEFTPLVELAWFEDETGRTAWLSHEGQADPPFVLVLVMFHKDAGTAQPPPAAQARAARVFCRAGARRTSASEP